MKYIFLFFIANSVIAWGQDTGNTLSFNDSIIQHYTSPFPGILKRKFRELPISTQSIIDTVEIDAYLNSTMEIVDLSVEKGTNKILINIVDSSFRETFKKPTPSFFDKSKKYYAKAIFPSLECTFADNPNNIDSLTASLKQANNPAYNNASMPFPGTRNYTLINGKLVEQKPFSVFIKENYIQNSLSAESINAVVNVKFEVNEDGEVKNIETQFNNNENLKAFVINQINQYSMWQPDVSKGKLNARIYNLTVSFPSVNVTYY